MSIFRETLPKYVQDQLTARTEVISSKNTRSAPFLSYVSGKNGWVRMASFVNYDDPKGAYSGDELAKKYVLEGGTLSKRGNEERLRFGLGTADGAYLSSLDGANNKGQLSRTDGRPLGIRPMPGITNVDIVNKSAYGSLKEATVRFYCWDKHQLEELELLYMRTGYTVLLEWGWSEYLESPTNIKNIGQGIDIFSDALTDEAIYNQIEFYKEKYNGNYDALLGHIKNFSWQLMPNGGYECSTVLISRGEIISTLRLTNNSLNNSAQAGESDKPLSTFERVFLNYKAWINNLEINNTFIESQKSGKAEDEKDPYKNATSEFKPIHREDIDKDVTSVNETTVANFITELQSKVTSVSKFGVYGYSSKGNWLPNNYALPGSSYWDSINKNKGVAMVLASGTGGSEGTAIEYIRLDHFLVIINAFFNLKDKDKNLIAKIQIPQYVPCLSSEDSVSVDPTVCLIRNSSATFITDTDISISQTDKDNPGFQPYTLSSFTLTESGKRLRGGNRKAMLEYHLSKNLKDKVSSNKQYSFGCIDNIYISISKIIDLYRSKGGNNPDGVLMIDYLKELLSQISAALGGINDFQLHVEKDQIRIIDVKYLEVESGDKSNNFNKYNFDLFGLKSICRDVKISSRIFDSQATMIAIAAQSRKNIGDLYSSTQSYFNRGLRDRILPTKLIEDTPDNAKPAFSSAELNYYASLWTSISSIAYYLKERCIGIPSVDEPSMGDIKLPDSADVNNAKSILKTLTYQINGIDVDYKAFIPFELEITLDGISGLVVGQIFTVDKSILPKDYSSKNLGFIITGLNHSLQNNDWTTTIKTQVCLLDQEDLAKTFSISKDEKKKIKEALAKIKAQAIKNQFLAYAITDFLYDKISNIIIVQQKKLANDLGAVKTDTYEFALDYIAKDSKLSASANLSFDTYLDSWFKAVKNGKLKSIYNNKDANFPQSKDDLKTFSLDGKKTVEFHANFVDQAFCRYGSVNISGTGTTLNYTIPGTSDTFSSYFSLRNNTPGFQIDRLSAANSTLWARVTKFESTYPKEFAGNLMYVNSIFGRGLEGKVKLFDGREFDLEDQGDKAGLTVKAKSTNLEVSNYKDTDKFILRGVDASFWGKNSGIEKYLSSIIINPNVSGVSLLKSQDLWNKLFEYVTKDFLSKTGGLSTDLAEVGESFQANNSLLTQIKGLGMTSIYDISGKVYTYSPPDPNKPGFNTKGEAIVDRKRIAGGLL